MTPDESDEVWNDGLPSDSGHNCWESVRWKCPECGDSVVENPFVAWCPECRVWREVPEDGA